MIEDVDCICGCIGGYLDVERDGEQIHMYIDHDIDGADIWISAEAAILLANELIYLAAELGWTEEL